MRIRPDCPACGGPLFLGKDGWLTCSYLPCPDPARATRILEAERKRMTNLDAHKSAVVRLEKRDPLA